MAENNYYLTVAKEKRQPENDGYIAVISLGCRGDNFIILLSCNVVKNIKEAEAWFEQQMLERPWETRQ